MQISKQCAECGGNFLHVNSDGLCLKCSQKDKLDFSKIKEYLMDHPGSSMAAISAELNISTARIQKYIDEGRIEIINKGSIG